jgi:SEC-C motif-containing protein
MSASLCPCGSGEVYELCCEPFLKGRPAPTALALMRSRYTAYVEKNIDYIVATADPKRRAHVDRAASQAWADEATWHGLSIIGVTDGGPGDKEGFVEFVVRYAAAGQDREHHERSRFRKISGRWHYLDAVPMNAGPVRAAPKPERNAPCSCGSGKKFKRCHGVIA